MLAQAAGLALLAAVSPTALLIASIYLGSSRPQATVLCYLAGAVLMSTATAIVVLVVLRTGGLQLGRNRTPRYGLRLGLGILLLATAVVLARRAPKAAGPPSPDPSRPARGIISRLAAEPAPVTALMAGLLVFTPSLTFLAAVQAIATAQASVPVSAIGVIMVVVISVASVWLPLAAFLAWPKQTAGRLAAFNAWLRRHGRLVVIGAIAVAGGFLVVNGLAGLAGPL